MRNWAVHAERVLLPDGTLRPATVSVGDGRIEAVRPGPPPRGARRLDPGAVLSPGFVDLQCNGGGGVLVNDAPSPEAVLAVAAAHRGGGTAALLATIVTDRPGTIGRAAALVARARCLPGGDALAGLHVEGPFISPRRPGVHPPEQIRPLRDGELRELEALGADGRHGSVLVTVAPEETGAEAVRRLADAGLVVAAGHTEADPAILADARRAGLRGYTHLFNAMPPLGGRSPGPVGACLDDDDSWCGLISDGIHVDPVNLRLVFRRKGPRRVVLVTDAMPVSGTALDRFELGGRTVFRRDGALRLADGTLGGADIRMIDAVRCAVALGGVRLAEALLMATATPADAAGLVDRGRIMPGCRADLLELADDPVDGPAIRAMSLGGAEWEPPGR